MKFSVLPLAAGLVLAASASHAAVIKPDTAIASSQFSAAYSPTRTIDGSGLPSPTDISAAHADYTSASNHWTTAAAGGPVGQWIEWGFTAPATVGAIYIWNHRSNGVASNSGYEPTVFDLTFYDSSNVVLASFDNLSLLPDNAFAQRFDFAQMSDVSRVRFDIRAVQSSPNYTGLAEVAFDTDSFLSAPIPEPATWAMMIIGFAGVGAALRARREQPFAG